MPKSARCHSDTKRRIRDRDRVRRKGRGNARIKRLRKLIMSRDPVCQRCGCARDKDSPMDHIIPVSQGGAEYDMDNLQGLCKRCHDKKTVREDGGFGNVRKGG